jgi:hypothetical protein
MEPDSLIAEQLCDESPLGFHETVSMIVGTLCAYCGQFWRRP